MFSSSRPCVSRLCERGRRGSKWTKTTSTATRTGASKCSPPADQNESCPRAHRPLSLAPGGVGGRSQERAAAGGSGVTVHECGTNALIRRNYMHRNGQAGPPLTLLPPITPFPLLPPINPPPSNRPPPTPNPILFSFGPTPSHPQPLPLLVWSLRAAVAAAGSPVALRAAHPGAGRVRAGRHPGASSSAHRFVQSREAHCEHRDVLRGQVGGHPGVQRGERGDPRQRPAGEAAATGPRWWWGVGSV